MHPLSLLLVQMFPFGRSDRSKSENPLYPKAAIYAQTCSPVNMFGNVTFVTSIELLPQGFSDIVKVFVHKRYPDEMSCTHEQGSNLVISAILTIIIPICQRVAPTSCSCSHRKFLCRKLNAFRQIISLPVLSLRR